MKANELRVDNLVHISDSLRVEMTNEFPLINPMFSVKEISEDEIGLYSDEEKMFCSAILDDLQPITLTAEWLEKLGFSKTNSTWYSNGRLFNICINGDIEWAAKWMGVRAEHIHQLQNLFFALTGEELTIKEDK